MFQATQQAHQKYEIRQQQQQRYIPGMNNAPPDMLPARNDNLGKPSSTLVKEFKTKAKNPAQCLHEYASQMKVQVSAVVSDIKRYKRSRFDLGHFNIFVPKVILFK